MPLKVIIIGAGIAGLSAAIALNREGHDVEIFEQSSFSNEVGAAIHIAPNASRILKEWGWDFKELQPVHCDHVSIWTPELKFITSTAITSKLQEDLNIHDEWLMTHRHDLHNALRSHAEQGFKGNSPKIHLGSRVESVDAVNGAVLLKNGDKHNADLIIGADGLHSKAVAALAQPLPEHVNTGQNCFRFLVPIEKLNETPNAKAFYEKNGTNGLNVIMSDDRRIVCYPCREGKLLNFVAICPSRPGDADIESSYLSPGAIEDLLKTFESFGQDTRDVCSLAEDVKLWSLATRDPSMTFVKGRLALVGDAAHPMLPHQGQGGAQAIEDAAALGALITPDMTPEEVPARLELYDKVRYARSVTVMMMSRVGDEQRSEMMEHLHKFVPGAEMPETMYGYAWASFPGRDARELLAASL